MKKYIIYFAFLFLFILPTDIKALSLEKNSIKIKDNSSEKIQLYANSEETLSEVDFSLIYSSYDVVGEFEVNPLYKSALNGVKYSVKFDSVKTGKILLGSVKVTSNNTNTTGSIILNNAIGITNNGKEVPLNSQKIDVVVSADSRNMLLKSIDSNIVKINLKDNEYKYDVTISDKVSDLDLKPVPYDENCKISISSQKISQISDGKIIIKASLDDVEEEYIINLNVDKKEKNEIKVDDSEFVADDSYKEKWLFIMVGIFFLLLIDLIIMKFKK